METRELRIRLAAPLIRAALFLTVLLACEPPEYPAPVITSIEPKSGSPGTPVVITGKYLNNVSGLLFGTVPLKTSEYSIDPSQPNTILTEVPVQQPGDVTVAFQFQGKTSKGISFKVLMVKPDIELIEPEQGKVGEKITIVGRDFSENLKIYFTGATQSSIDFKSPTVITAVIPNEATSGLVYLAGDGSTNSDSIYFSVLQTVSSAPSIIKIEPSSGKIGDIITIEGANFKASLITITLSDVSLTLDTDYTIVSDTKILLTLPPDAKSGPLVIKNEEGEDGRDFQITGPPSIDRVVPSSNQWGGPIIIFGKNLAYVENIKFGGTALLKPNFSYLKDYDGKEVLYGRVPKATPGNTDLILSGSRSGNSAKFQYQVLNGDQLALPLGFDNVVFPYSPQSPSLFNMNNQWTVNTFEFDRFFINTTQFKIGDEFYGLVDGDNQSIGYYKLDGSYIYIEINGAPYEGKQDRVFADKNVSRVVLTPQFSGTQIELIFPLLIERIAPAVIAKGGIVTITGRYFNNTEFQPDGFSSYVSLGDTQIFNVGEGTPDVGYVWISRTELKIKIPETTVPGNYVIKVATSSFDSNEVIVKVTN